MGITCVNRRQLRNKNEGLSQFPAKLCSRIKQLSFEWLTGGETWINYCTPPVNLLKSTGHVKHQQFNIQQLYVLPTLYLCVLYLSENKQRLVPLTA